MVSMLTTIDNPYDPFTEFAAWNAYDMRLGYNTTSLLARIVVTSDELSEADQVLALDMAIDEIVQENVSGMHKKVMKEIETNDAKT